MGCRETVPPPRNPMRRIPSACCALAASGHAAAPPSSVMNLRRFMGSPPQAGSRTLPHRCARTLLCSAARLLIEWQRWVKTRRTRIEHMLSAYHPIATAKRVRSFRAGERPLFAERRLWIGPPVAGLLGLAVCPADHLHPLFRCAG